MPRLRRLWLLLLMLLGLACASAPQPTPASPYVSEKPRPTIEGNPGESAMSLLARLTLTICKMSWTDAVLFDAELKLIACFKSGGNATHCAHELCDDVWPEPESL